MAVPAGIDYVAIRHDRGRERHGFVRGEILCAGAIDLHGPDLHGFAGVPVAVVLRYAVGCGRPARGTVFAFTAVLTELAFVWEEVRPIAGKHECVVVQPLWLAIDTLAVVVRNRPGLAAVEVVNEQPGVRQRGNLLDTQ